MKAIGANKFLPVTDPKCLIEFEAPKPGCGANDILVEVAAVGVNPVDTKIRASLGNKTISPPRILGWDAAGTVVKVGSNVDAFALGDKVFYAGDVTRPGSNAQFQAVDVRIAARMPGNFNFAEAAAMPLVGITAWELLLERMIVTPTAEDLERTILIINGAGGVGSAMIALAKILGLKVVATASRKETIDWCTSIGADHVINHHKALAPQAKAIGIRDFAYIANLYDTDGYWDQMCELIAPLGSIGCVVEPKSKLAIGDPLKAKCVRICWEFMFARSKFQTPDMHRQGMILNDIAGYCEKGMLPKLHTRILRGLSPAKLIEAHAAMENSTAHGKWVIDTLPESSKEG